MLFTLLRVILNVEYGLCTLLHKVSVLDLLYTLKNDEYPNL